MAIWYGYKEVDHSFRNMKILEFIKTLLLLLLLFDILINCRSQ